MRTAIRTIIVMGGLAAMAGICRAGESVTLAKDGIAQAVVVLAKTPANYETLAATELTNHLTRISGAPFTIESVDAPEVDDFIRACKTKSLVPIFVGSNVLERVRKDILAKGDVEGGFMLRVTPEAVYVAGLGEGTLFGAYELLEQLGVRWFMPGRLGTVIPQAKTVALPVQATVQAPSFPARHFQMGHADWQTRLRCGGPNFPSAHGLPGFKSTAQEFQEHPEYYAQIDGKRVQRQACVSNPDVVKLVVAATKAYFREYPQVTTIGMGPNDGGGFCECAECRKLDAGDRDPFSSDVSVTDRYIWFFNQVLDGIKDEFPDKKIGFYIYHTYMRPPVKVKPNSRITGALAPIALCRIHGPNNPVCPESFYYEWLAREWGKLIPELWDRGYWSNLACPGFPFVIVSRLREQIPLGKRAGIKGWRVETFPHWGTQLPSFYVAAKLMWNADADVDGLMADFAEKFFGPAAEPMGAYIKLMDATLRDADYHTGCAWDMPNIYPEAMRKTARALLAKGRQRAGQGIYGERVQMLTETFDYLDAFIDMMQARAGVDFVSARKALERLDAAAAKLLAYDPPMVGEPMYTGYMKRFYRPCIEQGYKRVTGGNFLAAGCKDEWSFLTDPSAVGTDLGYWRPELRGGNWRPIKTSSLSRSDQGFRYYKGLAWYRQNVSVPAEFKGKRMFLWCGGVDEKAKVWLNGKVVGISHGSAFYPFELDATEAVLPGRTNTLVFCVSSESVNELGTGGIVAPVILYAPAAGTDAKIENVSDLAPTFP